MGGRNAPISNAIACQDHLLQQTKNVGYPVITPLGDFCPFDSSNNCEEIPQEIYRHRFVYLRQMTSKNNVRRWLG